MSFFEWTFFAAAFFILGRWWESKEPPEITYDPSSNRYLIPTGIKVVHGKINI